MLIEPKESRLRRRLGDRGYAVALTGLLLLPMLGFTALAVDLGSWYSRAAAIQRASDAAALAGVTALPDGGFPQAEMVARQVAAQNGFVHGEGSVLVVAERVGDDRLEVTITDNNVPQYFTRVFRGDDDVSISRGAVAEYAPPVRMGSPRNFLGTSFLPGYGASPEGFTLSASSPCAPAEDGDLLLAERAAMYTGGTSSNPSIPNCNAGYDNPTYEEAGYMYGVAFDEDYSGGQVVLEVYNPYLCGGGWAGEIGGAAFDTVFTVRAPATDPFAGAEIGSPIAFGSNCSAAGGSGGGWVALRTITPAGGDMYGIQVQTRNPNGSGWFNNFALRARESGSSFQACSADPEELDADLTQTATGIAPENCPNVFAYNHLSIYAGASGPVVDGYVNATFFLASIGPEHSGKTLVIDLFDPGENMHDLRLLDPNQAHHTNIEWRVVPRYHLSPGGEAPVAAGRESGTSSPIDVSGIGQPQPGPNRSNRTYTYNDRQLQIRLTLPDIDQAYNGRTWWRLQYRFLEGAAPNDRTTWSISVLGDPVRLIE